MRLSRLSRRELLATLAGAGIALAGSSLPGCAVGPRLPLRPSTTLRLSHRDAPSLVGADLASFRAHYPDVAVEPMATGSEVAHSRLVADGAAGTLADVLQLDPDEVARFAAAGWVRDLTGQPGEPDLGRDEYPFVAEQTHWNGRRFATVSEVRVWCFLANREHLSRSSVGTTLQTYDDVRRVGIALQQDHVAEYAFYWVIKNGLGFFALDYLANARPMFDAALDPTFGTDPLYEAVLTWRTQALAVWKIVSPRGLVAEDTDEAFAHGWSSFTWGGSADLWSWQDPGRYRAGGKLVNLPNPSLVPGTHGALGAASLVTVSRSSPHPERAWALARHLGGTDARGQLAVPTRRWIEAGRGFGYRSLATDPAVRRAGAAWGDVAAYFEQVERALAPPGVQAPWFRDWSAFANLLSISLMRGELRPADFIHQIVARWHSLRAAWPALSF